MNKPYLIYGTAWKKERTTELVLQAWRAGFRAFDTACQPKHYREDLVGEALRQLFRQGIQRSELYLQTKFTPLSGQDPQSVPYSVDATLSDQIAQSFQISLRHLHTDYLDALLLHSPLPTPDATIEAWHSLEKVHSNGGTRSIGISNCYDLHVLQNLHKLARVKPTVVQNRFYAKTGYDRELRQWCRENNIVYQSFWTLTANPDVLSHPDMQVLSRTLDKTPAQVLFRYLLQRDVTPLTGTTDENHMRQDLAIDSFTIDAQGMAVIDNLLV